MLRDDLIWAAGFFDGEGCISIGSKIAPSGTKYYALKVSAFQNRLQPMEIFHDAFGGSIGDRPEGWIWQATGQTARNALTALVPYLRVKKQQAEIAVVFQGRKATKGGKYADPLAARALDEKDYALMKELKVGKPVLL